MIQLEPGEKFIVVRQLDNPADVNTYYMRAYVRNAETDVIIATINLTDKTDQRFRGSFYVPADPSGQGFYITVSTKVFTDSGYTTESTTYGREEDQHLVLQRWNRSLGGMGGGGSLRPSDIRKAIAQAIAQALKDFKLPPPKNITNNITKTIKQEVVTDFSPLFESLQSLAILLKETNIKIKDPEKVDFTPLENLINTATDSLQKAISQISEKDLTDIKTNQLDHSTKINDVMDFFAHLKKISKVVKITPFPNMENAPTEKPTKKRSFVL